MFDCVEKVEEKSVECLSVHIIRGWHCEICVWIFWSRCSTFRYGSSISVLEGKKVSRIWFFLLNYLSAVVAAFLQWFLNKDMAFLFNDMKLKGQLFFSGGFKVKASICFSRNFTNTKLKLYWFNDMLCKFNCTYFEGLERFHGNMLKIALTVQRAYRSLVFVICSSYFPFFPT